jgi:hypothetical protein
MMFTPQQRPDAEKSSGGKSTFVVESYTPVEEFEALTSSRMADMNRMLKGTGMFAIVSYDEEGKEGVYVLSYGPEVEDE